MRTVSRTASIVPVLTSAELGSPRPPDSELAHVLEPVRRLVAEPRPEQQRPRDDPATERRPVHLTASVEQNDGRRHDERERREVELEREAEQHRHGEHRDACAAVPARKRATTGASP